MRYVKAIAAVIGGLTPAAVLGLLSLFGVNVSEDTITKVLAAITPLTATVGVVVAPKNAEKNEQTEAQAIDYSVPAQTDERETIEIPQ